MGDELVLATAGRARVYGVSMKDRAAVLTSAHVAIACKESGVAEGNFHENVWRSRASVDYQLEFSEALIEGEKPGQNPAVITDMITISVLLRARPLFSEERIGD